MTDIHEASAFPVLFILPPESSHIEMNVAWMLRVSSWALKCALAISVWVKCVKAHLKQSSHAVQASRCDVQDTAALDELAD